MGVEEQEEDHDSIFGCEERVVDGALDPLDPVAVAQWSDVLVRCRDDLQGA